MKLPETTGGYAVKTWLYTVLAALLCFFLNLSITMVLSISTTTVLGVRNSGELADGRTLVVEVTYPTADQPEHRRIFIVDQDGTETLLQDKDVTEDGDTGEDITSQYPVSQNYTQNIRSETAPGLKSATNWVAQILMGILFVAFPYSNLWYLGDHDRNNVQFGHAAEDLFRGAKIGLLANIPSTLAWIVLVISRATGVLPSYIVRYRWMNIWFWPYFNHFIPGTVVKTAEVSWGGVFAMLPLLLVLPLTTGLGYLLGYKEFSVRDHLVYATTGKKPKRRRRR